MPDFRVADTAPEHPKLRAAGLAAAGLWAMAGAYSMAPTNLTDGWIPDHWVQGWPGGRKSAVRLVEVGLWRKEARHGIPGYQFHDWFDIQRAAAQIEEEKAAARERARKSRSRSGARAPERAPHVTRESRVSHTTPSPSPSPSPSSGDFGGDRPVLDAGTPRDEPPAPNLDRSNPRCPRHRDVPADDPGPPCRACRDIRLDLERTTTAAAPRRDLEARDCSWCDVNGWRVDPANRHRGPLMPGVRCDHTPLTVSVAS